MLPTSSTVTWQPSASVSRLNQARTLPSSAVSVCRLMPPLAVPPMAAVSIRVAHRRSGSMRRLLGMAAPDLCGRSRLPLSPRMPPEVYSRRCLSSRHGARLGRMPGHDTLAAMTNTPNAEKKTLILTGASRGIGHATVKRFASAGWRVITCSRHAFPENCPWEVGPEDHIQVDLADPDDTAARHRRDARAAEGAGLPPQRARQQCRHLAQGRGRRAARRHRDAARGLAARVPGQLLRRRSCWRAA